MAVSGVGGPTYIRVPIFLNMVQITQDLYHRVLDNCLMCPIWCVVKSEGKGGGWRHKRSAVKLSLGGLL